MIVIAVLLVVAAGVGPLWAGWHKRKDAARLQCLLEGHEWSAIFNALDNPQWPTRRCRRCGEQDIFTRCVCGKVVNRQTQEILEDQEQP